MSVITETTFRRDEEGDWIVYPSDGAIGAVCRPRPDDTGDPTKTVVWFQPAYIGTIPLPVMKNITAFMENIDKVQGLQVAVVSVGVLGIPCPACRYVAFHPKDVDAHHCPICDKRIGG